MDHTASPAGYRDLQRDAELSRHAEMIRARAARLAEAPAPIAAASTVSAASAPAHHVFALPTMLLAQR